MKKITTILLLSAITIAAITCKKTPEIPSGNKIIIGETTTDSISYFTTKVSTIIEAMEGNEIAQHGHCWSTEPEPTISDSITSLGKLTQPKTYSSELTNLSNNTKYYVRSYITYANGTVYGNEQNIKTLKTGKPIVETTQVTDVTLYSAVCGGIAQADSGLAVTTRGICWDTDSIFTITNCIDTTIVGNGLGSFTSNITGLNEGVTYYATAYATNEKGTSYGEVKKFTTVLINLPEITTNEITEITTNSALCGGEVINENNSAVTVRGLLWSKNQNPTIENNEGITENESGLGTFVSNLTDLQDGTFYYVRAYATNEKGTGYGQVEQFTTVPITTPTITTTGITEITFTSATSGGNVTSNGNGIVTVRGVCWNTVGNPTLENNIGITTNGTGTGSYTSQLTDLTENTTYFVAAYATNEKGTAYGIILTFTTLHGFIDPRDGQTYLIVYIGTQTWMAENLNYETGNSWCYSDNSANCSNYGLLYDWETIMNGEASSNTVPSGVQGICPPGWHMPSDNEWKVLVNFLGGENVAGGKMKEAGTTHWITPNTGATNSSGFTALPGGWRYSGGSFGNLNHKGYWWSSSEYSGTQAWYRLLYHDYDQVYRGYGGKMDGYSVRCLMN